MKNPAGKNKGAWRRAFKKILDKNNDPRPHQHQRRRQPKP